ncbi:MAG: YfhO family protein [Butyrivibrio sp.]|nr:YfhO family protein [Butyrivibrio sp.]
MTSSSTTEADQTWWKVSLAAFLLYVLAALPFFITRGLPFFYYGDYNVQQIPFYMTAHRAVRAGEFLWNWQVDLGGPLVGTFAFYLLGSPFFWLTVPFPESAIPYLMPFLMALKYSVCALTSYFYIRRYTKRDASAAIGALLFAFSGFNACNIVFNHFTDAVAFFPLLLLRFEQLMEMDHHRDSYYFRLGGRRFARFTLCVTLCAVINYYFFFGEVIFLILIFCFRYIRGNRPGTVLRLFIRAMAGGVIGVLIPAVYLVPAAMGVSGNTRLSDVLLGYDLFAYPSMKLPWDILKSMIMVPDIIGRGTLFYTPEVKNASLAIYLPMFGLSGVAGAFLMRRRKVDEWRKHLLIACLVISVIPGLNAVFSLMNSGYYARWFYMPILLMATETARVCERGRSVELRKGVLVSILIFLAYVGIAMLPGRDETGALIYPGDTLENGVIFWRNVIVTSIMYLVLVAVVFLAPKCIGHRKRILRVHLLLVATGLSCSLSTWAVLIAGSSLISDYGKEEWELQMLNTRPMAPGDTYVRTETDSTATNYDMVWGFSSLHSFISTIPGPTFDFLQGAGDIHRTVETNIPLERRGMRALLSARYYFENSDINEDGEFGLGRGTDGYRLAEVRNGISVYVNRNWIPMGAAFDTCISREEFDALDKASADDLLVRALILEQEDVEEHADILTEVPVSARERTLSEEAFAELCDLRRENACTTFRPDTTGFTATTADLDRSSLVLFTMPRVEGLTAYVDGVEREMIPADYGFFALRVPSGVHEIRVVYTPAGIGLGGRLTFLGLLMLGLYGWTWKRLVRTEE